jgi:uncharacterized protein
VVFPFIKLDSADEKPYTPISGARTTENTQLIRAEYAIDPGLTPKNFTVRSGQPVRMEINVLEEDWGCMGSIMIPGLYKKPQFMKVGTTVLEFTPTKKGTYTITCAMGLPHGNLKVE